MVKEENDIFLCSEPQKLDTFEAFTITKLNKEQRLKIYNQWKLECLSVNQIVKYWKLNRQSTAYMVRLIDRYEIDIYDRPNESFSKEFKKDAIEKYLLGTKSVTECALSLGPRSYAMLSNWIREYKKNEYNVVIKKKGEFLWPAIFYDQEYKYHNLDELTAAIGKYIEYYNNERIKERLKGLTPVEYRNQTLVS